MARGERGAAQAPKPQPRQAEPASIPAPRLRAVEAAPAPEERTPDLVLPTDPKVLGALRGKLAKYNERKSSAPDGSELYIDSMYKAYVLEQLLSTGRIDPDSLRALVVPEQTLGPVNHGQVFDNAVASIQLHIDRYSRQLAEESAEATPSPEHNTINQIGTSALSSLLERVSAAAGEDAAIATQLNEVSFEYASGRNMSAREYAESAFKRMVLTADAQLVSGVVDQHIQQFEQKLAATPRELTQDDLARGIIAEVRRHLTENALTRVHYFQSIADPATRLVEMKAYFGIKLSEDASPEAVNQALDNNLYGPYMKALIAGGMERGTPELEDRMEAYDDQLAVLEDLILTTQSEARIGAEGLAEMDEHGNAIIVGESADDWLDEDDGEDTIDSPAQEAPAETKSGPWTDEAIDRRLGLNVETPEAGPEQVLSQIEGLRTELEEQKKEVESVEKTAWGRLAGLMSRALKAVGLRREIAKTEQQLAVAESQAAVGNVSEATRILATVESSLSETDPATLEQGEDDLEDGGSLIDSLSLDEQRFFNEGDHIPARVHDRERAREQEEMDAELAELRRESLIEIEFALQTVEEEITAATPQTPSSIRIWDAPADERERVARLMQRRELLQKAMLDHPESRKVDTTLALRSALYNEFSGQSHQNLMNEYRGRNMDTTELLTARAELLTDLGMHDAAASREAIDPVGVRKHRDELMDQYRNYAKLHPEEFADAGPNHAYQYQQSIEATINELVVVEELIDEQRIKDTRSRQSSRLKAQQEREIQMRKSGSNPFSLKA